METKKILKYLTITKSLKRVDSDCRHFLLASFICPLCKEISTEHLELDNKKIVYGDIDERIRVVHYTGIGIDIPYCTLCNKHLHYWEIQKY